MKETDHFQKNLTIAELEALGHLSARAGNICRRNGLGHLSDILDFYDSGKKYISLQHCGVKSLKEFEHLYSNYAGMHFSYDCDSLRYSVGKELSLLTEEQRLLLQQHFIQLMRNLSGVAETALLRMVGDNTWTRLKYVIDPLNDLRKMPSVGKSKEAELNNLKLETIRFINKMHGRDNEQ